VGAFGAAGVVRGAAGGVLGAAGVVAVWTGATTLVVCAFGLRGLIFFFGVTAGLTLAVVVAVVVELVWVEELPQPAATTAVAIMVGSSTRFTAQTPSRR
jgi:hypothetical protein